MMGKVLAHYEIEERLGEGGSGVVYRARDLRLERPVAVKVLADQLRNDEFAWARLLREARLASQLSHPHIGAIYDLGEEDGNAFVTMEYIEGLPLSEVIPEGGMPAEQVRRYGAEIANALAYAHEHGVIHGDLKGSNILITSEGSTKLVDFGLGRRIPRNGMAEITSSRLPLGEASATAGTLPYLAPEVLRGDTTSMASDCWALGVLLYQMVTGELPFQGWTPFELSMEIMVGTPSKLGQVLEPLQSVVRRCLEKDPAARCSAAREVGKALQAGAVAAKASDQRAAAPTSRAGRSSANTRWSRKRRLWLVGGAVTAVVMLILCVILWQQGRIFHPAAQPRSEVGVNKAFGAGTPEIKVWVNTKSGTYHCPGTTWYGHTREGTYMTQKEAQDKGYRPAADRACL